MRPDGRPAALGEMPDDRLGTVAISSVVSELEWVPDVAPAVMDRISRDAVAYPEQFDRRQAPPATAVAPLPSERSAKRAVGRLAAFAVILAVIVALVLIAATASGAEAGAVASRILILVTETA